MKVYRERVVTDTVRLVGWLEPPSQIPTWRAHDGAAGTAAERSRAWVVALVLSVGSIAINIFALYNYKWRLGRIRSREPVEWGDPRGPAVIGSILIALLSLSLVLNTRRLMAGEI